MSTFRFIINPFGEGDGNSLRRFLEGDSKIKGWNVLWENGQGELSVKAKEINEEQVMSLVRSAGFKVKKKRTFFQKLFKINAGTDCCD
jgi:fido (protein-threonine AMPylation protein)